jgi:hypothetical protein
MRAPRTVEKAPAFSAEHYEKRGRQLRKLGRCLPPSQQILNKDLSAGCLLQRASRIGKICWQIPFAIWWLFGAFYGFN